MKRLLSTTALAAALTFGSFGLAAAQSTGQPGQAGQAGMRSAMSEEQLKDRLRERGYTEIEDVRREGSIFRISQARRYGETVDNLRVDATSGRVQNEDRLSEDQIENMLEERGYYDIENIERDGFTYTAEAKQRVDLRIDGQSGSISRERARNGD
ncbi:MULTISPECIES: PepSY domain-containing protein [Roseomonadaceae]|uniref:PepSY domain-containing protein n=1 Tax=Falsiroseomonas oleicola TaxID=2801474 RepID=A0ABS6H071_9PROT|nr:PepSY domain-containing protein [Roseomonas oleicola]MBU8542064.1 PepSY domain-containing protein [Roseomonas oleicola]